MDRVVPLSRHLERLDGPTEELRAIIDAVAAASTDIAALVALGKFAPEPSPSKSAKSESSGSNRIEFADGPGRRAEDILVGALRGCNVKDIISAGRDESLHLSGDAAYAVAIDALDGASNIETNMPLGTIFSISFAGDGSTDRCGTMQLAAGFIVYGPQTNLVLTLGDGVDIFTLDRDAGTYLLAQEDVQVSPTTADYAIDASNYRHWPSAVRSLIDGHLDDTGEPGAQTFNMRWIGSLLAEAYRILMRGGVFLCPPDKHQTCETGCQRLLTAAHPIAFIMEQAGARATTGYARILERATRLPNERTPFIFGSRDVVERIERLHALPESFADLSPLFGSRGLFRA